MSDKPDFASLKELKFLIDVMAELGLNSYSMIEGRDSYVTHGGITISDLGYEDKILYRLFGMYDKEILFGLVTNPTYKSYKGREEISDNNMISYELVDITLTSACKFVYKTKRVSKSYDAALVDVVTSIRAIMRIADSMIKFTKDVDSTLSVSNKLNRTV